MKRTKIMLTAIAVFAVAGGALAFKATKFGNRSYCVATTSASTATCPIGVLNRTFTTTVNLADRVKYTTTVNTLDCPDIPATLCTSIGRDGGL